MRHAYLVLAHEDPAGVTRLLAALRHPGVRFYVHVDARGDDDVVSAVADLDDVTLVPRTAIQYKAWSMVAATLELLRAAVADGHDRYTLLSGADYPLLSNAQIVDRLSSSTEQYLTFWRLEDRPSWRHKVQYHYPTEWISIRSPERSVARRVFWAAFRRGRRFTPRRQHPAGLDPYGGSQWWTLTDECVRHVLDVVRQRPDVVRFYRTTESPDELFFQTVVMNGPFAATVHGYVEYQEWRDRVRPWRAVPVPEEKLRMIPDHHMNLRYIDWDGEVTGLREAPAVLDETDLPAMLASGCLLARKVHGVRSAALLAELDRRRGDDDPSPGGDELLQPVQDPFRA